MSVLPSLAGTTTGRSVRSLMKSTTWSLGAWTSVPYQSPSIVVAGAPS